MIRAILISALLASGCLGSSGDDGPAPTAQILPAGSIVPSAADDAALTAQIRHAQGVPPVVPLVEVVRGGQPALAWDFGALVRSAPPRFVLVGEDGHAIDHLPIVDVVPGDAGYSPFWTVWKVRVTPAYRGELLTSVAALREAVALGLVEEPTPAGREAHAPIVTRDTVVMRSADLPTAPHGSVFYRGEQVASFELASDAGASRVEVAGELHDLPLESALLAE